MSEESSSIPFEKREGENPERFIPDGMNAIERNVKRIWGLSFGLHRFDRILPFVFNLLYRREV